MHLENIPKLMHTAEGNHYSDDMDHADGADSVRVQGYTNIRVDELAENLLVIMMIYLTIYSPNYSQKVSAGPLRKYPETYWHVHMLMFMCASMDRWDRSCE